MIDQTPESRFAGFLKPYFDSIGQGRLSAPCFRGLKFLSAAGSGHAVQS
jgi:hypothetical protein